MRSMPRTGSISYDDIRLVAAIAEAGTMRGAQKLAGGHLSTLYRQLRDLEARAGGPLFESRQNRLLPTTRAAPIVDAASDMLDRLAELERGFAAQDDRISGPLRVTTADSSCHWSVAACGLFRSCIPVSSSGSKSTASMPISVGGTLISPFGRRERRRKR